MKRASLLAAVVLLAFIVPMAQAGGTFTPSLIKSSPGLKSSDCITGLYNNPLFFVGYNSMRAVFFHDSWNPTSGTYYEQQLDQPYHRVRQESGQIIYALADANVGAMAFRMPPAPDAVGDGAWNAIAGIPPAGRLLTVGLYKAADGRDYWPEDAQLLIQWTSLIPESLNSEPNSEPSRTHPGDWLKFTVTPAYHLEAGKYYKVRLAWKYPQPASDVNACRIYFYQNRFEDYILEPGGTRRDLDKYGLYVQGSYRYGWCTSYMSDNTFTVSPSPTVPYYYPNGRDFSFGFIKAAAGTPVAYGTQAGDADVDGNVQLGDFATIGANWKVNKQKPLSDMNLPFPLLKDVETPVSSLVTNNVPQVFPEPNYAPELVTVGFTNDSPYVNWAKWPYNAADANDGYGLRSIAQSFKATSNATMGAIAVRLSTGAFPFNAQTSGYYKIKVYSLAGPNTVPTSGTLLKTFQGYFPQWTTTEGAPQSKCPMEPYYAFDPVQWDSVYLGLGRSFRQGEWLIWRLPAGGSVSLTANSYYSFTLEWDYTTDAFQTVYKSRIFRIDTSDPLGPDTYLDGNAFYKSRDASGVEQPWVAYDNGLDLAFAILPPQKQLCVADYEFSTVPPNDGGWPYNYRVVPGFNAVAGDVNGDCKVDFKDVGVLTQNWLVSTWK